MKKMSIGQKITEYRLRPKMKYYIPTNFSVRKNILLVLSIIMCVAILLTFITSATLPVISIHNNSNTNRSDSYGIVLDNGESITFRANTTNASNTWNWQNDKVNVSNNFNNYTTSWTEGSYHHVYLTTTNVSGTSNTIFWGINVLPAYATSLVDDITLLNETPADELEAAIDNNDFPAMINAPQRIYVNAIGLSFYAVIWFIVFGMQWIKQSSINIPAIVGVIFGGIIITFLPAQYQLVSQALIVFGIFAVIYVFYKGRG